MTLLEKLIINPEGDSRLRSPLVMVLVGAALIFCGFFELRNDTIKLGKVSNAPVIYSSDHPAMFVMMIVFISGLALALIYKARKLYLQHEN
ncbi:hypothetical protein ACO0K0_06770 [Undibacterium sp. SXout11W]|uniref:hypothetical protein n=1 Tax=Undibacterium sp. SXout11W TaxID=3413050 RepID=UPI003BF34386